MNRALSWIILVLPMVVAGCDLPEVTTDPPVTSTIDAELRQSLTQWGVVPIAPVPAPNPALVDLGRALVFDKVLSGNRDISCATCHDPLSHLADGLSLAIGTGGTGVGSSRVLGAGREFVPRNAPTLLNQGLRAPYLFWDGRVSGFQSGPFNTPPDVKLPPTVSILAAQAMLPVLNRREMRGDSGDLDVFGNANELAQYADSQYPDIWGAVMRRLLAIPEYAAKFGAAFPGRPREWLGFQDATAAMAAYITQAFSKYDSPFDRYLHRDDAALSPEAKRGALLFFGGRARCSNCHNGPLLGGQSFHDTGAPQLGPGTGSAAPLDIGRGDVIQGPNQPPQPFYRFAFRAPPLRNVELTAPYFHDGAYPTLEAVVRHYNDVASALRTYDVAQLSPVLRDRYHGGDSVINDVLSNLDGRLRSPLGLADAERQELVAFLKSLTDPSARDLSGLIPASVPSGLPVRE